MKKSIFALLALGAATAATADVIPTLSVSSPVQVGNLFQYTYTATLAADQALVAGNYFTIYDFEGFSGFGSIASGFTATSSFLGTTPSSVNVQSDSAIVRNATFTYGGATINQPSSGGQGVATELGSFQILSTFDGRGFIPFVSQGTLNNSGAAGTLVANIGTTEGPLDGGGIGATVPEPSVWAMFVLGFGAVGVSVRRRRPVTVSA